MRLDLFDIAAKRAALTPDRIALTAWPEGRAVTYAQLHDRAGRAAALLAARNVGPGDRIAVICRNRIEFFELLFAIARLGAILVPLNWRSPAAELSPLLADCGASLVIHGSEDEATAREAAGGRPRLGFDDSGPEGWEAGLAACPPHPGRPVWPGDETWYLIYTSGTTGRPKGVIQTYQMALVNYINIAQAAGLTGGDSSLCFLPLFHTAGINLHTLPLLIAGGHCYVTTGFDAGLTLALIGEGRLTALFGVPAIYRELALHPDFAATDLSPVRHWGCGGAPLPDVLVEAFAARGVRVCNGYGMTETGPTAFLVDAANALEKIGSVGKPQLLIEARIVDGDDRPVPQGETGEIQFFGPGLTPGYWERPEETAALFTPDGWLKSGDLGRADAGGHVHVAGRIKEMYISGGENVYPAEVENVLSAHPHVAEAAVIGIPDDKWGETGEAHVILKPGAHADAAELAAWCRARLAAFKIPKRFVFAEDFPRTAAGKVRKHLLPRQGEGDPA